MGVYGDRLEIDVTTGVQSRIPVDNVWVLANRPRTLLLTASKTEAAVDENVTITVQLRTPVLVDGTYESITETGDVLIRAAFNESNVETETVTLDETGAGSLVVSAAVAGTIFVTSASLLSNTITVEVV